jgi:hypothetical protein
MLEKLPEMVNGDAALVHRGRYLNVDFLVEVGDQPYHIAIREGQIATVEAGPLLMRPWRFAIRATKDAWAQFWQPMPKPGYHDLFAMTKSGDARIEGDLQPLMANLRYIKDILAAPRGRAQ